MNPGYWSLHYIIGFPDKSPKCPPAMQSSWIGEVVDRKMPVKSQFLQEGTDLLDHPARVCRKLAQVDGRG